jgi:hypothetical protein
VETIRQFDPGVIVFCTGDAINTQSLNLAEELGAFTCCWLCDIREPEHLPFERLDLLCMTSGGELLKKTAQMWGLTESQTAWVSQACLPMSRLTFEENMSHARWLNDLVFIGSATHPKYHAARADILRELGRVWGVTGRFKWIDPTLDMEKEMVTNMLPTVYTGSKVSFGHSDATTYGYHSNRLHLVVGNGGFYLCNKFDGLAEMYVPGEHCATYDGDDPGEVVARADYWMHQDVEREAIRSAGFDWAQKYHTYLVRCRELWETIRVRM